MNENYQPDVKLDENPNGTVSFVSREKPRPSMRVTIHPEGMTALHAASLRRIIASNSDDLIVLPPSRASRENRRSRLSEQTKDWKTLLRAAAFPDDWKNSQ